MFRKQKKTQSIDERYYSGKISAEEYVQLLLRDNEFDHTRREITRAARKAVGKDIRLALSPTK